MVGCEHDGRVVGASGGVERVEDCSEVLVALLMEAPVVVEVTQPRPLVVPVDPPVQRVLLLVEPLAVHGRLREQVVVEVLGQLVEHLLVLLGERGERVVLLPRRRSQERTGELELLAVLLLVRRLVDREPHDVVGVDERDDEEPRPIGRTGVGAEPLDALVGDDRVVLPAGARPSHEVAVVALPVGEAVRLEVRLDRVREVPLADVRRAVAGATEDRAERGDRRRQFGVVRRQDVLGDAVLRDVPTGEEARPRRRAR